MQQFPAGDIQAGADWPLAIKDEIIRNEFNGRVGQDLLPETEDVRVWRIALKPGERVGFHRHVLNYFWVAINAGRSRSHYAGGETREAEYEAGTTRHFAFGPANSCCTISRTSVTPTRLHHRRVQGIRQSAAAGLRAFNILSDLWGHDNGLPH